MEDVGGDAGEGAEGGEGADAADAAPFQPVPFNKSASEAKAVTLSPEAIQAKLEKAAAIQCDPKVPDIPISQELGLTSDMFRKIEKPIYGRLVPERLEATILKETFMVMDVRVSEIEGEMARAGEKEVGVAPRTQKRGGQEQAGGSSSSSSSLATMTRSADEPVEELSAEEAKLKRKIDREQVVIGSNLFHEGDPMMNFDDTGITEQELEFFDVPDRFEEKTEAEWVDECVANPERIHAHVLHFDDGMWTLKECWVRDYDYDAGRYQCELLNGDAKWAKRLCLRFVNEDPDKWAERIKSAKMKRKQSLLQSKFFGYIDGVSADKNVLAPLDRALKEKFVASGLMVLEPKGFQSDPMQPDYYLDQAGIVDMMASAAAAQGMEDPMANKGKKSLSQQYYQLYGESMKKLMFEVEGNYIWVTHHY